MRLYLVHSLSVRSHAPASAGVVVAGGLASIATPHAGFEAGNLLQSRATWRLG